MAVEHSIPVQGLIFHACNPVVGFVPIAKPVGHNEVNKIYAARRTKVFELLDLLNCTYSTNQVGMFVWAKIPATYADGYALSDAILYQGNVFITPGGIFGTAGNGFIRVSLCSTEEKLLEAIERIRVSIPVITNK